MQAGTVDQQTADSTVGTSEDWIVLDSGKSFAWSPEQHGSLQQQVEALEKLIHQQGKQVKVQHLLAQSCLASARSTLSPLFRRSSGLLSFSAEHCVVICPMNAFPVDPLLCFLGL